MELSVKLHRKRAFVTGAASGLGAAICMELAKDGWTIGMCDNRDKPLRAKMKEVDAAGGTALRHMFDVTDRAAYQKGVKTFIHDAGGIDLLVNNAGVAGGGFVGDYLLDDWEWLLNINLMGVVNGCHYFVPYMKEQRFGHVLNVASAAALAPVSRMAAYCTAKAGVRMLSEVLYNELYDYGVGVSVLMPECFRTNLHERTRGQVAETGKWLLENAPYTAEQVAVAALQGVERNQLHIFFPRNVRLWWWFSRLAPKPFIDFIRREGEKRYKNAEFGMRNAE